MNVMYGQQRYKNSHGTGTKSYENLNNKLH